MPRTWDEVNAHIAHWHTNYHQHPLNDSMLSQVLRTPELVTCDYAEGINGLPAECGDALSGFPQVRSTLIAPLKVEDRVLGTLELGCVDVGIYANKKVQRLVEAVAPVIATAIEGAQSGGSAEIQDRQREALKNVSTALTQEVVDQEAILRQIVVGIAQSLGVASAIVTMDITDGHMHLAVQEGLQADNLAHILYDCYPVHSRCIIGNTFISKQPNASQDIAQDERFPANVIFFSKMGMRSIYCYPLISGSAIYGVLLIGSPEAGGFTPLKVDILSLFANQATLAFHNSQLLDTLQQRSHFQEIIERLERAAAGKGKLTVSAPAELLTLLEQVQDEAQHLFGVSFGTLLRFVSRYLLTRDERALMSLASSGVEDYQKISSNSYAEEMQEFATAPVLLNDTLSWLARRTEAALRRAGMLGELSELLMQLTESTGGVRDAWFMTDLEGNFVYMNPTAEALSGISMSQVEDMPSLSLEQVFAELLPRTRNASAVRQYLYDVASGENHQQVLRCVLALQPLVVDNAGNLAVSTLSQPPGETLKRHQETFGRLTKQRGRRSLRQHDISTDRHYQLMSYPLRDKSGQLVGRALRISDVTEQVREEQHRSALLSAVSHDLRTPLTTIKTAVTGLLQEGVVWDTQDWHDILADIDTETDHLTVLVNDLVDLSRIEMGALSLEREWCDVVEVVNNAIEKNSRNRTGHTVHLLTQPQLSPVLMDFGQIERVFISLIENAERSSPVRSTITIIIDLLPTEALGQTALKQLLQIQNIPALSQWLRVRVIDQGEGIPEQEWDTVFKSFYTTHADGNELSLAICKGIIEAHQGYIWVESVPTCVNVTGSVVSIERRVESTGACFAFIVPVHTYHRLDASNGVVDDAAPQRRNRRKIARAGED